MPNPLTGVPVATVINPNFGWPFLVSGPRIPQPTLDAIVPELAFPSTPVLDDFTQTAETSPPTANWSLAKIGGTTLNLTAVGDGTVEGDEVGSNYGSSYWNVSQFLDSEIYIKVTAADVGNNNAIWLFARGSAAAYVAGVSGNTGLYSLQWSPDGWCAIQRGIQVGKAAVAGAATSYTDGDSIGLRVRGTDPVIVEAWRKQGSGPWVMVKSFVDYSALRVETPGYVGFGIFPVQRVDLVGGGELVIQHILATSTVSGAITIGGSIRPITPTTNVLATSTVAGAIGRLRPIIPAQVSAFSTVSGSLTRIHPVPLPTTLVSATSTVSGAVRAIHLIKPITTIAATSTVNGNIRAIHLIKPTTTIAATSTVSGSVKPLRRILPAIVTATSTVSGVVGVIRVLSGGISYVRELSTGTFAFDGSSGGSATISHNANAGDLVVLFLSGRWQNPPSLTITDSRGNTWITAYNNYPSSTHMGTVLAYTFQNAGTLQAGDTVLTDPTNTADWTEWLIEEFSGVDSTQVIDASGSNNQESSQTSNTVSTSGATSQTKELAVIVLGINAAVGSVTGDAGWSNFTTRYVSNTKSVAGQYKVVSTVSTPSATIAWDVSQFSDAAVTTFKASPVFSKLISATSIVSGVVTKSSTLKLIAPTTVVVATSTVSGRVVAIRRIAPTTVVAATSVVSGAIGRIKPVVPTLISATSTVNGSVRATHLIKPTTVVAATSIVSGSVKLLRPIVPAAVAATSTISGNVKPLRRIGPATVTATSTVNGTVVAIHRVVPAAVAATSTVSGKTQAIHVLVGNVAAASTVQGLLKVTRAVRLALVTATSTVSGAVITIHKITPATVVAAISTVAGVLIKQGVRLFTAMTVSATSTVSGRVTAIHRVAATTISATSTVSGGLRVIRAIRPTSVAATSTVAGTVRRLVVITSAQVLATSTVTGQIRYVRRLPVTSISAFSTVTGTVRLIRRIVVPGNVLATSSVTASFTKLTARRLTGNISATSTVSGVFTSAPLGSVIYFAQSGTITMSKTGRIDYKMTGSPTWAKTGEIEPENAGVV